MSFKDISSSGGHFVQGNGTSCVILVKGIMGNNSVIFLEFGAVVQVKMPLKIVLIQSSSGPRTQRRGIIYAIFVEGFMENFHVKLF